MLDCCTNKYLPVAEHVKGLVARPPVGIVAQFTFPAPLYVAAVFPTQIFAPFILVGQQSTLFHIVPLCTTRDAPKSTINCGFVSPSAVCEKVFKLLSTARLAG